MAAALLSHGADPSLGDASGATPMHVAAMSANHPAVRLLAGAGSDPNARDSDGRTPLHSSVMWRRLSAEELIVTVEALLEHGADPNVADFSDESPFSHVMGFIPSFRAARSMLLHGANPGLGDGFGDTPVHKMASRNHDMGFSLSILPLCMDAGFDPDTRNVSGETALHALATSFPGNESPVRLASSMVLMGFDPEAADLAGRTPVETARDSGRHDMADAMLSALCSKEEAAISSSLPPIPESCEDDGERTGSI